ncbi:hypothetical protein C826_01189 [Helicobacter bilis WiWa]|uniref:Uncharacterized protein n=1 Tax=Helicobacter bilis WiWa TaxID=1235804 RepID=N2BL53_9HELI|nr:hypothetical protein [Helicobacter bilis]EMZ39213.1 hypothetical protein C826_01189 [Helicobacter bilis WiWa]
MTDIIVEIGKVWFENEIILLILIVIIFLASKIGFIKYYFGYLIKFSNKRGKNGLWI